MIDVFDLLLLASSLGLIVLALTFSAPHNYATSSGFIHLAALICWQMLGLPAAALIVGAGVTISLLLMPAAQRSLALIQVAANGALLLVATGLYGALGGTPIAQGSAAVGTLPLSIVVMAGFAAGQGVTALLVHWLSSVAHQVRPGPLLLAQVLIAILLPWQGKDGGVLGLVLVFALAWWSLQYDRVRAQLQRRVQELDLLNSISQFTSDNLNLDDVLDNIYRHIDNLVHASIFYVAIYYEDRQVLDFRLVIADGKRLKWRPRHLGEGTAEYVIRKKQLLHIAASQRSDNPELQHYNPTIPHVDYLGVPLLVGAQVVGVMAVMNTAREGGFSAEDIQILQTVASQAALAVRNAMLYTRQVALVDRLSHMNESVYQVLLTGDEMMALRSACEQACRITGMSAAAIFTLQEELTALTLTVSQGLKPEQELIVRQHPPTLRDQVRVIADLDNHDDAALHEMGAAAHFQSLVEVPLRAGKIARGVLVIYDAGPTYILQEEIDLLVSLASQVSAMLENLRLFAGVEQYALEMAQLAQLAQISTASLDMSRVGQSIAEMLRQITGASRVVIVTLDADRARVLASVNGQDGLHPAIVLQELADLQRSVRPIPRVYRSGEMGLSMALRQNMHAHQETLLIMAPLIVDNQVMGALLLGSQEQREFELRDQQFIELASNQIAAQINNVQLYERMQRELSRRLEQVALAEEVAQQVSSSMNFETVIAHVFESAAKAVDADMVALALLTHEDDLWVIEKRTEGQTDTWDYYRLARERGLAGEVLRAGHSVLVPSLHDTLLDASHHTIYASALGVPLQKDNEILGALLVASRQSAYFNSEQASFLISLAGHALVSIENARFLEARQAEIDLLHNLRELSLWLVSADDTASVAYEIIETAVQLLQGRHAVLYAYETDRLHTLARLWYSEQRSICAEETFPYQLAWTAAQSGQLMLVEDVQHHPEVVPGTPFDYDSVVVVPLMRAGQVRYVLLVTFTGRHELLDSDQKAIDLLASQALGHLENASLHETIRAARDQMRAILDSTRDGLILLDRSARLIETNPSAHQLLGFDLRAHLGKPFPEVLAEVNSGADYPAGYRAELLLTLNTQPETETRHEIYRQERGQSLFIEEIGLPVRDAQGQITGRLLVLRNVTEARLLEEQREDFTDMVIHDLRGPLGGIANAASLIQAELAGDERLNDSIQLAQTAYDNAQRLLSLVETLLDISRMQRPGLQLQCQAVPLAALVTVAFSALRVSMQEAHIAFTVDLPSDLPPVFVDREKIERVLINLLDNAVRYTPTEGSIRVSGTQAGQWVEVRIADTGPGIPLERRADIFERFRRIPGQEPKRGHKGHGLGLNFARLAVEHHGGTIQVVDDCNLPGACFMFTLPIAEV